MYLILWMFDNRVKDKLITSTIIFQKSLRLAYFGDKSMCYKSISNQCKYMCVHITSEICFIFIESENVLQHNEETG